MKKFLGAKNNGKKTNQSALFFSRVENLGLLMAEDLFAQNEQEYSRVGSSVQRRLRNAVAFTGDAKRLEFETIDKELQAADRFLEKMESEARRALSMRSRLENRLANYRSEQQSLKQEFSRARHIGSATGKGYGTPNGWDSPDASVIEVEQRQRLLGMCYGFFFSLVFLTHFFRFSFLFFSFH